MLSDADVAVVNEIGDLCKLLYDGYHEDVDYTVEVAYHAEGCPWRGKALVTKEDCAVGCTLELEKRTRKIKRKGLLEQLKEFAKNRDTDRSPKAERGAPRVKVPGRPPGDMAGFFTLDEIECNIPYVVDRVLGEAGRDRTWAAQPTRAILIGLSAQAGFMIEAHPDQARELLKAARRWVSQAKRALKIEAESTIFDSVVCGNCGGGLSTPAGNRGDAAVRCVGTPDGPPCGEEYPPGEWLGLYQRSQHDRARERS